MWSSDVISVEFILGLLMMPKWRRGKGPSGKSRFYLNLLIVAYIPFKLDKWF